MITNAIIYIGIFEPTFNPLFKKEALTTTPISPKSDDHEEIFKSLAQTIHTAAPIIVGIGISTK
jgi:hypothetical protein